MNKAKIVQKKPFMVTLQAGKHYWCACGESKNQPFCDGSHKGTEFIPRVIEVQETKTFALCGCKHSQNGAFCDGSHSKL